MLDFGDKTMTCEELYDFLMGAVRFRPDEMSFAAVATLRKHGAPLSSRSASGTTSPIRKG